MKTQLAALVAAPDRFWSKVDVLGDCWEWLGYRADNGYGRFVLGGRGAAMEGAHCVAYTLTVGPVPAGLELDHLCRNRGCVNPAHLEPVTHVENVRRGIAGEVNGARQRGVTHCPQGHEYDEENTRWGAKGSGRWSRSCKACAKARRETPGHRARNAARQAVYRARKAARE